MSETKTFPTYPTDDMWEAFFLHHHANDDSVSEIRFWEGDFGNFAASYAAMRAAAPAPVEAVNTNLSEISSKLVDGPEGELARLERELAGWFADDILEDMQLRGLITSKTEWSDISEYVSGMRTKSLRYLAGLNRIEFHPTEPNLVRVKEQSGHE